ncbi:hypothetical protein [Natrarchaeobius chitinivorans]|uniref:Uncharacterized protein n=1 Tax=Natrarchaeobius chitinivorans TaxID=1679083 RepID=A0A3N6N2F8_NATCH|nr:hypothetical protein [Natrarchaeobius chitinivorans]RQG92202.1 hypothetical protein EA473_16940 [Natrarchaeobius chitinivorans]
MPAAFATAVDSETILVVVLVAIVATVHLLPDELPDSVGLSRENLLSLTGGVSIVYRGNRQSALGHRARG